MEPAYFSQLKAIESDIEQWREFGKRTPDDAGLRQVDNATKKIITIVKPNFFQRHFSKTDYDSLSKWVSNQLIESRKKMVDLTQSAYNSNDPKFQEEALNALSRLNAQIANAKDTVFGLEEKVSDKNMKSTLREMGGKMGTIDEYQLAKLRLGEKVQFHHNKPIVAGDSAATEKASPHLHKEGVKSNPPTETRPYWVFEKDVTSENMVKKEETPKLSKEAKTKLSHNEREQLKREKLNKASLMGYLMNQTRKELANQIPFPEQFVRDLHRMRGVSLEGKTLANMEEEGSSAPQKVFNALLEASGGNRLAAYRLTAMISQTVIKELTALALVEAVPPTPPEEWEKYGPRWGLGSSGGILFDIHFDKAKQAVLVTAKIEIALMDGREEELNPGALLIKREWTIPIQELQQEVLDKQNPFPGMTVKDSWSGVLKTDAYAREEIIRF